MSRRTRGMMQIGAIGAMAGLMLIPAFNARTRKRITRSTRNAYFRVADFVQDMKDRNTR